MDNKTKEISKEPKNSKKKDIVRIAIATLYSYINDDGSLKQRGKLLLAIPE